MALMSIVGRRMGTCPILACRVVSGRPLRIRLMSVLVPPTSMVMTSPAPISAAKCAPATTPPAGPDSTRVHRLGQRGLHRHEAAGRFHHHDGRVASHSEPALRVVQAPRQRAQIALHQGREERVEHHCAGALELAELAQDIR